MLTMHSSRMTIQKEAWTQIGRDEMSETEKR